MASKRPKKQFESNNIQSWDTGQTVWGGGEVGVPQTIMRALCAIIRPDHFKFASYGPDLGSSASFSSPFSSSCYVGSHCSAFLFC